MKLGKNPGFTWFENTWKSFNQVPRSDRTEQCLFYWPVLVAVICKKRRWGRSEIFCYYSSPQMLNPSSPPCSPVSVLSFLRPHPSYFKTTSLKAGDLHDGVLAIKVLDKARHGPWSGIHVFLRRSVIQCHCRAFREWFLQDVGHSLGTVGLQTWGIAEAHVLL